MTDESDGISPRGDEYVHLSSRISSTSNFVVMANGMFAGLGGLYVATRSVLVTAVGGGLVVLAGLAAAVAGRHRR